MPIYQSTNLPVPTYFGKNSSTLSLVMSTPGIMVFGSTFSPFRRLEDERDAFLAHLGGVLADGGWPFAGLDRLEHDGQGVEADDRHLAGEALLCHHGRAAAAPGSKATKIAPRSGLAVRVFCASSADLFSFQSE